MGDNLKIRKLRLDIANVLNESRLPVEVKRMVIDDFNFELTRLAEEQIQKEMSEETKGE